MYRIVEQVDNTFLDGNFGNHDGNLYKQHSKGTAGYSLAWLGSNQELYNQSVSLENHQNKNDWSDFIHFLDILNNTTDKQFRDSIRTVFDVDEYLQILAFDVAVNNLDYYGNSGRNYYLYNHNGKFHWVPWDYNLTWQEGEEPIDINPEDYPVLTKRILQVPEFYATFPGLSLMPPNDMLIFRTHLKLIRLIAQRKAGRRKAKISYSYIRYPQQTG